jgi:hypothetical protein
MLSVVRLELKVIILLPARPFLVVTKIAPFPPAEPYNAEAEAPFRKLILSISSGLIELNTSPGSGIFEYCPISADFPVPLIIGIPSITYSGWVLLTDLFPHNYPYGASYTIGSVDLYIGNFSVDRI